MKNETSRTEIYQITKRKQKTTKRDDCSNSNTNNHITTCSRHTHMFYLTQKLYRSTRGNLYKVFFSFPSLSLCLNCLLCGIVYRFVCMCARLGDLRFVYNFIKMKSRSIFKYNDRKIVSEPLGNRFLLTVGFYSKLL